MTDTHLPLTRRRTVLKGLAASAAAPLLGSALAGRAAAQAPTRLVLWAWLPGIEKQVAMFTAANPGIEVEVVNAGQTAQQYLRLRNALAAGTGAPDVAQFQLEVAPSFIATNALADLAPYGANDLRDGYVDWAWSILSRGDSVYGLPWDSGPLALLYRADVMAAHGLEPPATWEAFAEQARRLKADGAAVSMTNAPFMNASWLNGMLWQAGWRPFQVNGAEIDIAINSDAARRFAAYWQPLLDEGAVDANAIFNTEWYTALDQGRYATLTAAAWAPAFLTQFAEQGLGQWRAALLPQWTAGENVSGNWGGSTLGVIHTTQHPEAAAKLVLFLLGDPEVARSFTVEQSLFPTRLDILQSEAFATQTRPFFGDHQANPVFIQSARGVDPAFQWSPFQEFVNGQIGTEFGAASGRQQTLDQAFDAVQRQVVEYARGQGFTVRE